MRRAGSILAVLVGSCLMANAQQAHVAPTDPLSPQDEAKSFKLPPGFKVQLVAADPTIHKPMQMAFDAKGRLWATTSQEYPFPAIGRPGKDRLYVLDEIGADGKAAKVTVFADDLNIPIGVLPLPDGKSVLVSTIDPGEAGGTVAAGCWILKLTDTDGDGKADKKEKLYGPFGIRDTHGMVNSFNLLPDGWVYACHGFANDSKVKGKDGHEIIMNSGHTFRFRPDGQRIEVYSRGQVNPFGMTFDPYYTLYTADCHSKPITQVMRGAMYESFGKPHDGIGYGPNMINHDHGSTGLCGLTWYDADHFPAEYKGTMFLGNVVTNRVNFDKIEFVGSTPKAVQQPDFISSRDPWFRPVDIKLGLDGALYVSDFYNKIIGHYEVDLKHPGRDRTRGRIWRIVWKGQEGGAKPLQGPGDLTKKSAKELDTLLGSPNMMVRHLATLECIQRRSTQEQKRADEPKAANTDAHEAHRAWAEYGPLFSGEHVMKKVARPAFESPFIQAHEIRLRTATKDWERDYGKGDLALEAKLHHQKVAGIEFILRAECDAMTAHPDVANLNHLLDTVNLLAASDTHTKHAHKIALRATLRDPQAWELFARRRNSTEQFAAVAEVCLGLPTPEAAKFIVNNLPELAKNTAKLPQYIEHATRYGAASQPLFAFLKNHQPENVRLQALLFQGYQRGLQQKNALLQKDDLAYADALIRKGLGQNDGPTIQTCLDLSAALKAKNTYDAVATFAMKQDRDANQRALAFSTLLSIDAARAVPQLTAVLLDEKEAVTAREKAAQALGSVGNATANQALLTALERAPARLQTVLAAGMASRPAGAELLLNAVQTGKASGQLLQDRVVQARLRESRIGNLDARLATLTKGLPSPDARVAELIAQRRDTFNKAKPDASKGAVLFKNNCANCHQLKNEGAKIGPQLDGIGLRGLERLLEDILDPSRNVDQALRSTSLLLKDGRTVAGLVLREEGAVIIVADAMGKEVRVPKNDVDERRTSSLSPMPANFAETMKPDEFEHLLAFLLTQQQKDK